MFGLGMPEILLILAIALMVIGPKKLPDLAKTLGRALGEFKNAAQDFKKSIDMESTAREFSDPVKSIKNDLKDTINPLHASSESKSDKSESDKSESDKSKNDKLKNDKLKNDKLKDDKLKDDTKDSGLSKDSGKVQFDKKSSTEKKLKKSEPDAGSSSGLDLDSNSGLNSDPGSSVDSDLESGSVSDSDGKIDESEIDNADGITGTERARRKNDHP